MEVGEKFYMKSVLWFDIKRAAFEKSRAGGMVIKGKGLEINADKTKYMVMSRDQTAGRSHSIKIR